jgi:hypothetical protein
MLQTRVTNVGPPLTIIGKDLEAGATFNGDIALSSGVLLAGRLMSYDPDAKVLSPITDFTAGVGPAIFGLLADGVDATSDTEVEVGMVYRDGTFLRQEIEVANQVHIPAGGGLDQALRAVNIDLEYSYDEYVGMAPIPPGAGPIP